MLGGQLLVASGASRRTPTTSPPRTGVYLICARNVRRTGRAGPSRAQVDLFPDAFRKAVWLEKK